MDAQSGRPAAIAVQAPPEQDAHLVIDEAHQRSKAFGVCSDDAPDFSSLAISSALLSAPATRAAIRRSSSSLTRAGAAAAAAGAQVRTRRRPLA